MTGIVAFCAILATGSNVDDAYDGVEITAGA